jgi:para-nitrobenzyl esterase
MTTQTLERATVRVKQGELRGVSGDGFVVFRGVPFAAAPAGARRFAPPQPAEPWQGVRNANEHGTIAPQNPSRLAHVMGHFQREHGEDCLSLTTWVPEGRVEHAPVVVWLHGGAFTTGAGSLDWYSGESFARAGVIVVGVNYRLGALGFLYRPGLSPGNLGLLDQVAALRWVRENIAAFGGDPLHVTVMGQSAGGASIGSLFAMREAQGLFRRAILQSPALQRLNPSTDDATENAGRLLEALRVPADQPEKLRAVPVADILAAQGALGRRGMRFADPVTPFRPVLDGTIVSQDAIAAAKAGASAGIDILIGTTREEMAAFYTMGDSVPKAPEAQIRAQFDHAFGAAGSAHYDEYRRLRLDQRPAAALADLYSDILFRAPSLRLAEVQAAHRRPAYVFQFDWQSPSGFEACHCLELPFTFDNLGHWQGAPMLKGGDPAAMARLARIINRAWIAFARTGDPNHDELPHWAPYRLDRRMTMRFDTVVEPVGDLAGRSWRKPWPDQM